MADLDVVIVNYNAGDHLLRCVASVFERAGGADVDVIVVDNDSHDGSARRVEAAYPQVRLIANPHNRGFGSAVNQGIASGRAGWILALNPDAELSEGDLGSLLEYARAHPRSGAIGVLVRDPGGALYPSARRIPTLAEAAGHALVG
ncbi:MAG: glycosyltransferase, partial [Actinobacteria bacterium]|nr:glycosyltransferase [Actinomycetota bacterium]